MTCQFSSLFHIPLHPVSEPVGNRKFGFRNTKILCFILAPAGRDDRMKKTYFFLFCLTEVPLPRGVPVFPDGF
jgi:hypothetical protein